MSTSSQTKRGIVLVCLSAAAFSTAGIFTKSVEAVAWDVIFWRGLSAIAFTFVYLVLRADLKNEVRRFGGPALLAAVLMASGTATFIPAFKITSVANVSLIWATAPFFGAVFAWTALKEVPSVRVLICSGLALIGGVITVRGSMASGNIIGDLLALWMMVMMAATMVLYRARPDTPTKLPAMLSAALLLPFAIVFSNPAQVIEVEISVLVAFGAVFSLASVLLAEGARLISSAKTALVSALETPLAPIWAVLILSEWPTGATVLGGAIIMIAAVFSQRSPRTDLPKMPALNAHLRRDVGFDDAHVTIYSGWRDPLAVEVRRLH